MLRHRLYYQVKPFIPTRLRHAFRRLLARSVRPFISDRWPILPGSEKPPPWWKGWPDGKQFALVLTHDVERREGLERTRDVMRLEMELGFRSAFNFVPEGNYELPDDLRRELQSNGFEVGVHDLHHDGKLFVSRQRFRRHAARINEYLRRWDATGFRAGFMLHELEWYHDLDIAYDSSTFDTDPFEPQPDGVGTIFPFFVPTKENEKALTAGGNPQSVNSKSEIQFPNSNLPLNRQRNGYVELPYTLPQDSTVFLFLEQKSTEIWDRKLDWIARHGGMALLITHPDYMAVNRQRRQFQYPINLYTDWLQTIRQRYGTSCWYALPREISSLFPNHASDGN